MTRIARIPLPESVASLSVVSSKSPVSPTSIAINSSGFPSVQSISFPESQDISFDTSILWSTASAYTVTSQEPSLLNTIDESPSNESPSIITSPSSPSLMPTAIVSVSVSALSRSLPQAPTVRSPSLQVLSSTTVVTPSRSPRPSSVVTGPFSPSIIASSSPSPSLTPTAIVTVSVSASYQSLPHTVRSSSLQVPSSTMVATPSLS